jgi:hypothetical protein
LTESGDLTPQNLKVPPRTGWVTARSIWVSLMLKLQMKAKPVHFLKDLIIAGMNSHRLPTPHAYFLVSAQSMKGLANWGRKSSVFHNRKTAK